MVSTRKRSSCLMCFKTANRLNVGLPAGIASNWESPAGSSGSRLVQVQIRGHEGLRPPALCGGGGRELDRGPDRGAAAAASRRGRQASSGPCQQSGACRSCSEAVWPDPPPEARGQLQEEQAGAEGSSSGSGEGCWGHPSGRPATAGGLRQRARGSAGFESYHSWADCATSRAGQSGCGNNRCDALMLAL